MQRDQRKFWGIVLIIVGLAFLLDRTGILNVNIFFDGWWTLFLIIPAIFSITKQGLQTGNAVLLALGIYFLLEARGWNLSWLVLPGILIILGVSILIRKS